jgi:hypothetical protein
MAIIILLSTVSILIAVFHSKISYQKGLWLFAFSFSLILCIIAILIAYCSLLKFTNQYQDKFIQYFLQNIGSKRCKWIENKLHFDSISDSFPLIEKYLDERLFWSS